MNVEAVVQGPGRKPRSDPNVTAVEASVLDSCVMVGEVVASLFGPRGAYKIMQSEDGSDRLTDDPAVILDAMCVPHPIVKMIAEAGDATKREVGDGTTTSVLLASALVKAGMELAMLGIPPAVVAAQYAVCLKESLKTLRQRAQTLGPQEEETLLKVASTALGKVDATHRRDLARIVVDAVRTMGQVDPHGTIDLRAVKLEKRPGGSLADSYMLRGTAIAQERARIDMPAETRNAKVALLKGSLELPKPEVKSEVEIASPASLNRLTSEVDALKAKLVDRIAGTGANVIVIQGMSDKPIEFLLAGRGITLIKEVGEYDLECLAKATAAQVCGSVGELSPEALGTADRVREVRVGDDRMTFFENRDAKSVTILVRGGYEGAVETAFAALGDGLFAVRDALRTREVVGGGGAAEMEVAARLKKLDLAEGKLELVTEAYANAIESVVTALFMNSGLDRIDALTNLQRVHGQGHAWAGLDADSGTIRDVREKGILHPLEVKEQAFISATEAAASVLRIGHIIRRAPKKPSVGEVRMTEASAEGGGFQFEKSGWLE